MVEKKPPPPPAGPPPRDFEKFMGPLGKKWHDGGCVRVFLLLLFVGTLTAYLASFTRMFR